MNRYVQRSSLFAAREGGLLGRLFGSRCILPAHAVMPCMQCLLLNVVQAGSKNAEHRFLHCLPLWPRARVVCGGTFFAPGMLFLPMLWCLACRNRWSEVCMQVAEMPVNVVAGLRSPFGACSLVFPTRRFCATGALFMLVL